MPPYTPSTPAQLVAALRDLAHDFETVKSLTQATSALYFASPSTMLLAAARTLEELAVREESTNHRGE